MHTEGNKRRKGEPHLAKLQLTELSSRSCRPILCLASVRQQPLVDPLPAAFAAVTYGLFEQRLDRVQVANSRMKTKPAKEEMGQGNNGALSTCCGPFFGKIKA